MKRFRHVATIAFLLIAPVLLLNLSSLAGRAQGADVTPVPPLSWPEMQALEQVSSDVIKNIHKSCCVEHGKVWATESPYLPGGCIIDDAFKPDSSYQSIQNCETLRLRAAVAPYVQTTPIPITTDTPSPTSEGVQFTLRVEAPGHESAGSTRFTQGYDPSSIDVWGLVTDQSGTPIAGATVTLVDLGVSVTTDSSGFYQLYVSTEGSQPYQENLDWALTKAISGANVTVNLADVLPSSGEAPLEITATDQDARPLGYGTVVVSLIDGDKIPFLTLENDRAWLDADGRFSTRLILRQPDVLDFMNLKDVPLDVTINVEILDKDGRNRLGQTQITRPFNLALIHGVTVGPDMQPRAEEFEPELSPYAPGSPRFAQLAQELFLGHARNDRGDFWVLVAPLHPRTLKSPPQNVWQLKWGVFDHLPLYFPLPQAPAPGQTMELGKIDVLTPEEHEEQIKSIVREFIQDMPLTASARGDALNGLNNVVFEYHSTGAVPFFKDNFTSFGGSVVTPHSPEEYWGHNLVNGEDAAYVIMLHEMGHFVHHTLVERHNYLHVCYNKLATGGHETWQAPTGKTETGQMYLSFAESAGDFYAYVAYQYWANKHPEIKDSVYFKRAEYLPEFDDDKKAQAVLDGGTPGYKVEGVQTRFLRAYYGARIASDAVGVYSDYLATMLRYMDVAGSWIRRPARTIQQWVQTKQSQDKNITALASRYQLLANPVPVIVSTSTSAAPRVRIGDQTVDFADLPVREAPFGVEIEVQSGNVNVDLSTNTQRRNLYLQAGTLIVLHSDESVEVKKGLVGADYAVKIKTPTAQITPSGTMFVVRVAENGETQVQTLRGQVQVTSAGGASQTLNAGQQLAVSAGGAPAEPGAFDVAAVQAELAPLPEPPFDPAMLDAGDTAPKTTALAIDPIGVGLVAALVCCLVLLLLFLRLARARRKRKSPPSTPPSPAGSGWQAVPLEQLVADAPRAAELVVGQGPSAGLRIPLGASCRLGRDAGNDVVIGDPQVSRQHALITAADAGYVIADLDSANGTRVNGQRIAQPQLLRHQDTIAINNETFVFRNS